MKICKNHQFIHKLYIPHCTIAYFEYKIVPTSFSSITMQISFLCVLNMHVILMHKNNISVLSQGYDGEPPKLLKEEPEDGPRSCIQKVPSLSDLSEESIGEYRYINPLLCPLSLLLDHN